MYERDFFHEATSLFLYRVPTLREQYRGGAVIACPVRVPNCYEWCFLSVVVVVSEFQKKVRAG